MDVRPLFERAIGDDSVLVRPCLSHSQSANLSIYPDVAAARQQAATALAAKILSHMQPAS